MKIAYLDLVLAVADVDALAIRAAGVGARVGTVARVLALGNLLGAVGDALDGVAGAAVGAVADGDPVALDVALHDGLAVGAAAVLAKLAGGRVAGLDARGGEGGGGEGNGGDDELHFKWVEVSLRNRKKDVCMGES